MVCFRHQKPLVAPTSLLQDFLEVSFLLIAFGESRRMLNEQNKQNKQNKHH
jgi:hypothetical protein